MNIVTRQLVKKCNTKLFSSTAAIKIDLKDIIIKRKPEEFKEAPFNKKQSISGNCNYCYICNEYKLVNERCLQNNPLILIKCPFE